MADQSSDTSGGTMGASADSAANARQERGWPALKAFMFGNKYDAALWLLRLYVVACTLFYLIPLLGLKASQDCFKRVLLGSATISALRLHQRMPRFQFSRSFFTQLVQEDAFHYLMYSVMFLLAHPATMVLMPIVLFAILHAAAYSRKVLEISGAENSLFVRLRGLVAKVEDRQSQQSILQFIASSEILMMPVTILMLFSGQASLLVPFFYYRFLQLRYASRRNPYSRLMFNQMRLGIERVAAHPRCPSFGRRVLNGFVGFVSRLAPGTVPATA